MPGVPRTIDAEIPGPQQTQQFALDGTVTFDLEAVYIEIDASGAGGPVTAELTILEQSGVVIARKAQKDTVDAGGAGSATWALRLDDDDDGGGGGAGIEFDQDNVGTWLNVQATGADPANPLIGVLIEATDEIRLDGAAVDIRGGILESEVQEVKLAAGSDWNANGSQVFIGEGPNLPNTCNSIVLQSTELSFFGAPPVVQPAAPATLADVIAALQALGLTA